MRPNRKKIAGNSDLPALKGRVVALDGAVPDDASNLLAVDAGNTGVVMINGP